MGELREIRKNWSAIRVFLELVYGRIRGKRFAPNNRRILRLYVKQVWFLSKGFRKNAKVLSSTLREKAILGMAPGLTNRGKTDNALFVASTLSRGLVVESPPAEDIEKEIDEAFSRLTEPEFILSSEQKSALSRFIEETFKNSHSRKPGDALAGAGLPARTSDSWQGTPESVPVSGRNLPFAGEDQAAEGYYPEFNS